MVGLYWSAWDIAGYGSEWGGTKLQMNIPNKHSKYFIVTHEGIHE